MGKLDTDEIDAAANHVLPRGPLQTSSVHQRPIQLHLLLPSIVTTFAICAGLTSVKMSIEGHLTPALWLIVLAIVLDGLDGKLARFLDAASPFGAELDTLADFFNFGIAPGILLYCTFHLQSDNPSLGWLSCLVLAICCALRLARFNLALNAPKLGKTSSKYFEGVPAPALACLVLMPAFILEAGWTQITQHTYAIAFYVMLIACLAISTIPTFSIKYMGISRNHIPLFILGAAIFAACIATYPWQLLCIANILYLGSLPISYRHSKRQNPK